MAEELDVPADMSLWLNRPLGYLERETRDCPRGPGPKRCTINSVSYLKVTQNYVINIDHFKKAVRATVHNEPHLRTDVTVTRGTVDWVPASDFSDIFQYIDLHKEGFDSLVKMLPLVETEANRIWEYGSGKPLYRCILVRISDAYVVMNAFHHAVADGISSMVILNSILWQYNRLQSGNEVLMSPRKPMESTETLTCNVKDDVMVTKMMAARKERELSYSAYLPPDLTEVEENDRSELPVNKFLFKDGDPKCLTVIKQYCKELQLTVGSVLVASTYLAIAVIHARRMAGNKYSGMKGENVLVPVNLRERIKPPVRKDACALLISDVYLQLDVDLDTTLWTVATEVSCKLKEIFAQKEHLLFTEAKKRYERQDGYVTGGCGQSVDAICSNIGQYPFEQEFPWGKIAGHYIAGSMWTPEFCNYFFSFLATDRLHYSLVHCPGENNSATAKMLLNLVCTIVESAGLDRNEPSLSELLECDLGD